MSESLTTRDMEDYAEQYQKLPFESIQNSYRRKVVLREVERYSPKRLLEIGCGMLPLFTDLSDDVEGTVVEPTARFVENARRLAGDRSNIEVVQSFVEDWQPTATEWDVIVLSCVLHEVPDPVAMLHAIKRLCGPNTVLHVNVPNALSLHRLLAVAMGLIATPTSPSLTQRTMQQRDTPYDAKTLETELVQSGFSVIDRGSLFIKPFTHGQMQSLVDQKFMTVEMLDGLHKLVSWMPEFGSEIWLNAKKLP